MNLQTILFGQFTPPLASKVLRHSILQEGNKPLKPYEPPAHKPNLRMQEAERMYEFIAENPGCCVKDISEALGRAVSYVYRIRDILDEQGRITSVRGKPIKRGGPKTSLFYVKDRYAG